MENDKGIPISKFDLLVILTNWNSKASLIYDPVTVPSADGYAGGRTGERTDGQCESSIPPSNLEGLRHENDEKYNSSYMYSSALV